MKTPAEDRCSTRFQDLRKKAKARSAFTSVHLLVLAFILVMAFGGIMKIING